MPKKKEENLMAPIFQWVRINLKISSALTSSQAIYVKFCKNRCHKIQSYIHVAFQFIFTHEHFFKLERGCKVSAD